MDVLRENFFRFFLSAIVKSACFFSPIVLKPVTVLGKKEIKPKTEEIKPFRVILKKKEEWFRLYFKS